MKAGPSLTGLCSSAEWSIFVLDFSAYTTQILDMNTTGSSQPAAGQAIPEITETEAFSRLNEAISEARTIIARCPITGLIMGTAQLTMMEIQEQFAGLPNFDSALTSGHSPRKLGSLSAHLQSLFAGMSIVISAVNAVKNAYGVAAHLHRFSHALVGVHRAFDRRTTHLELHEDGCSELLHAGKAITEFLRVINAFESTFSGLIRDEFPNAGELGVRPDRTVVEISPILDTEESVTDGFLDFLDGFLSRVGLNPEGRINTEDRDDDEDELVDNIQGNDSADEADGGIDGNTGDGQDEDTGKSGVTPGAPGSIQG